MSHLTTKKIKLYRPICQCAADSFMFMFCNNCEDFLKTNASCNIWFKAFSHRIDDPEYPNEWRYNEKGQPICTEFKKKNY